jgi:EAL domain-containing protein (putative c-di-GMP-specific phosphodiesterase class I)
LSEVARRHESLRTRFVAEIQVVDPPSPVALPEIDLAGLPAEQGLGEARRLARAEALRPFDLIVSQTDQLRSILPVDRPMVIEITEHVPIDDYDAVRAAIDRLGDVALSVDDTGAGYASMRHILELGPAYAKLDISLVRGIDGDSLRESLSAGLVYYATRSGFSLIAEGVETEGEASKLRDLGVDLAQGYLFGRPAALTES